MGDVHGSLDLILTASKYQKIKNKKKKYWYLRKLRDPKGLGTPLGGKSDHVIGHKPFLNFLQNGIGLSLAHLDELPFSASFHMAVCSTTESTQFCVNWFDNYFPASIISLDHMLLENDWGAMIAI